MDRNPVLDIGSLFGLKIRAEPSALAAALATSSALMLILWKVLKWRPWAAVCGGIAGAIIHFLSEIWHQLGHARAAQQSGFPMDGMTFTGAIALSVYPANEGFLPAETHIQRALGGPIFSLLVSLAFGVLVLPARLLGDLPLFLTVFAFLDNLLVFTIGALLPLGFTDGSTLLEWRDKSRVSLRVPL